MSIELEHSFDVPVPPDQAWDVLLDVQRVAPCMPGATVESVDGDEVRGKIKVKVGPIAMTYTGKATFTERDDAAHWVKIEAAGKETRGAGTASAVVLARLNEDNGQTRVNVHTTLNVTGRPAQFGRGVMAEVSGKIIERFSANLAGQLASAGAPEPAVGEGQAADSRMAIPIQELNLPARSAHSLQGEGIDTVGQLVSRTKSELLSIRNLGQKSVAEIEQRLGDLGLSLARQAEADRAEQSPAGQSPAGQSPAGQSPAGQSPAGQSPAGQSPAGQSPAGQSPAGQSAAASAASTPAAGTAAAGTAAASASAASVTAVGTPDGNAAWDGSRPVAWTGDEEADLRLDEPEDDALNLFDVAAGPILKRALPAAAVTVLLIWVGTRIRRRGRRRASSV
jgi:carbon monoxide dehydrogenase subunit G